MGFLRRALKLAASFVALVALWGVRAWIVVVSAFFGVVILGAGVSAVGEGEWLDAVLLLVLAVLLLVVSYRWFAVRWRRDDAASSE